MAQVEVIAPGLDHPASTPAEEGVVGQPLSHGAAYADHFGLEPEAGYEPALPDPIEHLSDAVRKPDARRLPFPHVVPPAGEPLHRGVVPAGVDTERLRTGIGGRVDERQQPLGGRVPHQGVHVVVVDHRQPLIVRVRSPGEPAVLGQLAQGGLPAETESDCGRDGTEGLTGPEYGQPLVIGIGGPTQGQC